MPFEFDTIMVVLVLMVLLITVLLILWRLKVNRTLADQSEVPLGRLQAVAEARIDPGENEASLISEQVEEMVRAELDKSTETADLDLDFGTDVDGSLAVWFGGRKYSDPAEIPDSRVRAAVIRAVERFNQDQEG